MSTTIPPSLPFNGSPEENGAFYHAIQNAVQQGYSCEQILNVLTLPSAIQAEYPTEAIQYLEVLSDCIILTTPNGRAYISSQDQYQTANELSWRICQASADHSMFSMAPLPIQLDTDTDLNLTLNWLQPSITLLHEPELHKLTEQLHVPSDFWDQKHGTFALISEPFRFRIDCWQPEVSRVAVHLGYFPPNTRSFDYSACIPLCVLWQQDLCPEVLTKPVLLSLEVPLVLPALDVHALYQLFTCNPHWHITDGRSTASKIISKPFSLRTAWLQWNNLFFVPLPTKNIDSNSLRTPRSLLPSLATLTEHLPNTATYAQRFDTLHSALQAVYTAEQLLQLSC